MHLALSLLGTFDVRYDGQAINDFRAQSVRALFAYLAIEADRPHEREHLCGMLWPDEPPPRALASLRQALHRLRLAIEPADAEGRYLIITRQSVQLNLAAIELDTATFARAIRAVSEHRHRAGVLCTLCAGQLRAALELYRGDLLPGFGFPDSDLFEEWLHIERERLREQLTGLLDQLAGYHERRGEHAAAVELLRRWAAIEPWNETAHLRLIGALARAGQRTMALHQFERFRATLAADLGVEPGPGVTRLVAQVRAGALSRPATPELRHAPAATTPFVGRARELAELTAQLNDPTCRLLTLTGPGGSGKTRLAVEAAHAVCYTFADGAVFVSLAAVERAEQAPELIGAGLDLSLAPDRPPLDQLIGGLRERELLLVLDNCEQVADLAALVAQLLSACPRLTLLATSRSALNLRAEWVVAVAGLGLAAPAPKAPSPATYAAGQLFLQVAGQVRPAFAPGAAEEGLVLECCALVDGSPLAIELAATRLRELSLAQIVAAVRADLRVLATTMEDVHPRHRSLRAVFDWSWRLLDPAEQQALAALAVFGGGCDRAAAAAVVGAPALLDQLVARSLLHRAAGGRYTMHAQIRQFAEERLAASGAADVVGDRHADYYLGQAAAQAAAVDGPQAVAVVAALQNEHENLRRAWCRAAARPNYQLLGAAAPVFRQIYARSDLYEGVAQFAGALAQLPASDSESAQLRQQLLDTLIGQLLTIGRPDEAQARAEELRALARATADPLGQATALLHLGDLAISRRECDTAWAYLAQAEWLSAGEISRRGRIIGAHSLLKRAGLIDWQQLPPDRSYAERAYARYCELDMPHYASVALNRLGNQHRRCGDYGRSLAARRRAAELIADQGDLDVRTLVLNDLGEVYLLLGHYQQARAVFEQALAMARRIGVYKIEVAILEGLGRALFHLGELRAARGHLKRALTLDSERAIHAHRGYCLTTLGYVAERAQNWKRAERYYADAVRWWEASGHRSDAIAEPRAGLARVALATQNSGGAMAHIEAVLPFLVRGQLQDALEPMWVHLSCYQALAADGDWRAAGVLARAHALLIGQADQFDEPALRDTFLGDVVAHRAILAAGTVRERSVAA